MENKEKNKRVSESSWSELTSKWFSKTKNCEVWNFKNYFRVDFFFYSSKMILMNSFYTCKHPTRNRHRRLASTACSASPCRFATAELARRMSCTRTDKLTTPAVLVAWRSSDDWPTMRCCFGDRRSTNSCKSCSYCCRRSMRSMWWAVR